MSGCTAMMTNLKRAARLAGMRPMPRWRGGDPTRLQGKRILLTGASSGIGAVAAAKLAARGATVIAVARREHALRNVLDPIVAAGGIAVALATDLTDFTQI